MIILRNYQGILVKDTLNALHEFKTVMMQLGTGGGKTVVFNDIIRRCFLNNYGVLVLAHRKELIQQCARKLFRDHKIYSGIIMSGIEPMPNQLIQVASVQTLTRRNKPKNIKLIIIDEGHHATAKSYRDIIAFYPDALVLAVSATPIRTSGEGFEDLFNHLVCGPTVKQLEEMKFLSVADIRINPIDPTTLKTLKLSRGDYNERQLSEMMQEGKLTADAVDAWRENAEGLPTVVFCVDIQHAEAVKVAFVSQGIEARAIHSKMKTRDQDVRDFEKGKYLVFINVGVATEGTDFPFVRCIQLLRPTKSVALYLQMCGRGSRVLEDGSKDKYMLLDHANNFIEHGAPNKDRKWTLKRTRKKGERRKDSVRQFKMKLEDGTEEIVTSQNIPLGVKGLKLIEIEGNFEAMKIEALIKLCNKKGHKKMWVYFTFLNYCTENQKRIPEYNELLYIAKRFGFSEGWAYYKHRDLKVDFKNLIQK